MRMWPAKEKKYARFSLRTRNKDTAIDKAKAWRPYRQDSARALAALLDDEGNEYGQTD
jgi:hypothetical protein